MSAKPLKVAPGARFGRWTVVCFSLNENPGRHRYFTCRCDCGTVRDVSATRLAGGYAKGCGCGRSSQGAVDKRQAKIARKKAYAKRVRKILKKVSVKGGPLAAEAQRLWMEGLDL